MSDAKLLADIISQLENVGDASRTWILSSLESYFNRHSSSGTTAAHGSVQASSHDSHRSLPNPPSFSAPRAPSVKELLLQKKPRTDVERVACLAYFLTHHRGVTFFKTADISSLNTEAAQLPFSNASFAIANAQKGGYLVPGSRGTKQLSAAGEQFVALLPDRQAADAVMNRKRRNS